MSCNRDSGCLNIYQNVYPNYKSSIGGEIDSINENISEVNELLNGLYIPDDYLGTKIKSKLEIIDSDLDNCNTSLLNESSNINSFIDEKINEHSNHYITWLSSQKKSNEDNSLQIGRGVE